MAHDTRSANLSNSAKPDCHTIRHNATRSTRYLTRYRQATRCDTLANPSTLYTTPHATRYSVTLVLYSTAHRAGRLGHGVSLRNLFSIGRRDGMTGLPHDAQLAQLQMRKTPLPRKTPYFPLSPSFVLCSYADLC